MDLDISISDRHQYLLPVCGEYKYSGLNMHKWNLISYNVMEFTCCHFNRIVHVILSEYINLYIFFFRICWTYHGYEKSFL